MLSFKRLLYIVLIVAVLGGIFLIYNTYESQLASVPFQSCLAPEREFIETVRVDEGERPRVWILGDSKDERYGQIYENVRQFCEDLHLPVIENDRLDMGDAEKRDLVIFCDVSISRYADPAKLERFVAGGGRVILAAGLAEKDRDPRLWPVFGIREKSAGEDCHELVFEKPLLPVQPEQAHYDGNSSSSRIEVSADASVYIRDAENGVPILYTYPWREGGVCLINGTFLTDIRCMGLLTGAIGTLLPDFIYPVLGVKAVFLDNFPEVTPASDKLCKQVYGYSTEGFIRDVVWPAFQGASLRTNTPYTASILAASSDERFGAVGDELFTAIGKSVLQFDGELVYAADCPENGKVVFNVDFFARFSEIFPSYTIQGMALESDHFSPEMLEAPGADVRSVRGMLGSDGTRLSWRDGHTVFPAATAGNSMEDGNLFAVCSVLGAYGLVSHVFDVGILIGSDKNTAAWDLDKRQIGLFESEVLARVPWLEGRTLARTGGDVRSYQNMDYGWTMSGSRIELDCSGAVKGQAFFYHTDSRIADAEGLTYQEVGNEYYLLRIQENHGTITLEEGE